MTSSDIKMEMTAESNATEDESPQTDRHPLGEPSIGAPKLDGTKSGEDQTEFGHASSTGRPADRSSKWHL